MFVTVEKVDLLNEAEQISKMITNSDLFAEYKACLYRLKSDQNAQALIQTFSKMKERYEEVERFGKYHPDFTEVTTRIRTLKREMDMQESIAAFKKAEEAIQMLLDEVSMILGRSVSEHVKVPTGNPFFDSQSSCGGGCGSGGSCGCS